VRTTRAAGTARQHGTAAARSSGSAGPAHLGTMLAVLLLVCCGAHAAAVAAAAADRALTPVPPWTRVTDYIKDKKAVAVRVPPIEGLIKENCWRTHQCSKWCQCPPAVGLPEGSPECCAWSATVLDFHELEDGRGCLIDIRFGDVSQQDLDKQKRDEQGSYLPHPMTEILLGVHGDDTEKFGVHGESSALCRRLSSARSLAR
jgi:hypothetical protein